MPHLYPHKSKGWRIIYRVFFLDGTEIDKTRWAKSKSKAMDIFSDVDRLERFSRQSTLTQEEVLYCLNKGYVNDSEAARLVKSPINNSGWNELRKEYEKWSRAECGKTTHSVNVLRLGKVIEYVEGTPPRDFKEDHIKRYIQKRKGAGAKDWTIRHEQVILRKLLDYLGGENQARKVPLITADDEVIPEIFARQELAQFMRLVKSKRDYKTNRDHLHGYLRPVVFTYLYAGLRPSEMVLLEPKDIHADKITVRVTKTGKPRSVEIHPKLRPYINSCLRKGGNFLFGGDTQLRPETISLAIRRIIAEAELTRITPYSLRHTFVTELLRAGADLRYVMDKAGHKKISTTTRYLHRVEDPNSPVRKIKIGIKEKKKKEPKKDPTNGVKKKKKQEKKEPRKDP